MAIDNEVNSLIGTLNEYGFSWVAEQILAEIGYPTPEEFAQERGEELQVVRNERQRVIAEGVLRKVFIESYETWQQVKSTINFENGFPERTVLIQRERAEHLDDLNHDDALPIDPFPAGYEEFVNAFREALRGNVQGQGD